MSKALPLVIIESPYAGQIARNTAYARSAMRDSLAHGEAPLASHLLYTQPGILNEDIPEERTAGILSGYAWMQKADYVVFYTDFGMSKGMKAARDHAQSLGVPIAYRRLDAEPVLLEDIA